MGIILWIIFGALVGWIASMIMRTDEEQGAIANIIIGIVGALVVGIFFGMMPALKAARKNPIDALRYE